MGSWLWVLPQVSAGCRGKAEGRLREGSSLPPTQSLEHRMFVILSINLGRGI